MPRPTRIAVLVLVNAAVFAVAAEVLAVVIFYYQHGWLFYAYPYRKADDTPIASSQQASLTAVGLHPYFGPTHRAGIPFDLPSELRDPVRDSAHPLPKVATNNFGFVSPTDYPFTRAADRQFLVGIFGGSVAAWFCELGTTRLAQALGRAARFQGREVVPLCFSHEGYKQPQPLLVLAYFLSIGQRFDAVVNINGFNEVALSPLNDAAGMDISMPSTMHLQPLVNLVNQSTLTRDKIDTLAEITHERDRLRRLAPRLVATPSAAVYFVLDRIYAATNRRYRAALARFDALPSNPPAQSVLHVTPPVQPLEGDTLYQAIAANWADSAIMMRDLLAPSGVPFVQILQPNQYATRRPFSDSEARIARLGDSPFKPGAERGYPFLEKEIASGRMQARGVYVADATTLFDREPRQVYVDNCCHYTRLGNDLLGDFVAETLVAVMRR